MIVSAIERFDLTKSTVFSEEQCPTWLTMYSVLSEYRESTDRLDRASQIFRARANNSNPNSEINNDIQLFLVSFEN